MALSLAFFWALSGPWGAMGLLGCGILAWWAGLKPSDGRRLWFTVMGCSAVLVLWRTAAARMGAGFAGALGVSYYSLQAVSYAADARLGVQAREENLGRVLLFLAWFPKALQGPFERCSEFLRRVDAAALTGPKVGALRGGLVLLAWGLFQKAVVAERAAQAVDASFSQLDVLRGPRLYGAVALFGLQLFADFSGYTDMARGLSKLFGVELSPNFKAPFLAPSVAEFWRRWHISLSDWVRDYLFTPLQMALRSWGAAAGYVALAVGFGLVGLWHGVEPGFLALGLCQALWIGLSLASRRWRKAAWSRVGLEGSAWQKAWRVLWTLQLTLFSLLLFRARSGEALRQAAAALGRGWNQEPWQAFLQGLGGGLDGFDRAILALGAAALVAIHVGGRRFDFVDLPGPVRWMAYGALVLSLAVLGRWFAQTGFLYARL